MKKKIILTAFFALLIIVGVLFYFRYEVYYSHGPNKTQKMFEITKGEGNAEIAARLKDEGLISGKIYFYYYIKTRGLLNTIMPGEYQLSGEMSIPEIARVVTNQEAQFIKVTFPEGMTAKDMADKLNSSGLPGDDFLNIVNNPGSFKKRYSYLTSDNVKTLEGYLFPDTYFFKKDIAPDNIVGRLLDNFDAKLTDQMRKDISAKNQSINNTVIMASILEKEVQTPVDMKIVSGIFWNRLSNGQKLQSDATLSYILDDNTDSHSGASLETNSPFNTYMYQGLPPTPIGNPGLNALTAAIYPTATNYNYFLTATVDGAKKVIYASTYQEHLLNKSKYGL